jgi:phosphoribosylformylglycinamidine cyclo-ligase
VPRVLPPGLAAEIDAAAWPLPAVFRWIKDTGGIAPAEMARTFNCGLGMVAVVAPERAAELTAVLEDAGERVWRVGRLVARAGNGEEGGDDGGGLILNGAESAWSC